MIYYIWTVVNTKLFRRCWLKAKIIPFAPTNGLSTIKYGLNVAPPRRHAPSCRVCQAYIQLPGGRSFGFDRLRARQKITGRVSSPSRLSATASKSETNDKYEFARRTRLSFAPSNFRKKKKNYIPHETSSVSRTIFVFLSAYVTETCNDI